MAIVVEDGSGVEGANSYVTAAQLLDYAEARAVAVSSYTLEDLNALLIKAMDYIEAKYGGRFKGCRVDQDQALHWPRYGAYFDGYPIPSDSIPANLQNGQLAAAIEADSQDILANESPARKRERIEGAVEVEYFEPGKRSAVASFVKADALLMPLSDSLLDVFFVRS